MDEPIRAAYAHTSRAVPTCSEEHVSLRALVESER